MNDIVDELPEGFIEVEPQLLLELAVYALKDLVVAATDTMVTTEYCSIRLVEPTTVILSFNPKFGLFADIPRSEFLKIKQSYIEVDHEVQRIKGLN